MRIFGNMKKAVMLMLAATALIACRKNTDTDNNTNTDAEGWTTNGSPIGTWSLSSWNDLSEAVIYLSFSGDGTFELYQRVYSIFYEYYDGTWHHSDGELSGTYSNGDSWGAYYVAFRGDEMMLTHSADETDVSYFVKSSIPDEVLDYVNPDSKANGDSEVSTFRNSGRFL